MGLGAVITLEGSSHEILFEDLLNKPIIQYLIERLRRIRHIDQIFILQTSDQFDTPLQTFFNDPYSAKSLSISDSSTLQKLPDQLIVVDALSPFIDISLIEELLKTYSSDRLENLIYQTQNGLNQLLVTTQKHFLSFITTKALGPKSDNFLIK